MRPIVIVLAVVAAAAGCRRSEPAAVRVEPAPAPASASACGGTAACDSARMEMHGMHRRMAMHRRMMMMRGRADGAATAIPATAASADSAGGCPAATPALVDEGRSVFAARGNCAACHGAAGGGTPMAPDLTDGAWLHGDGSYQAIAQVVAAGVPRPLRSPGVMPAKGGADLAPAEVCAVAAYVRSLSGHQGH